MKLKLDKPFAMDWEGWDQWEKDARQRHPVRYFLTETLPLFFGIQKRRIKDAIWWIRYRVDPRHRYHIVKTGLSPGYYDKDSLMLHACFNLLKEFVEHERPFDHFDTENSPNKEAWIEIRTLYDWWTKVRPARKDPFDEINVPVRCPLSGEAKEQVLRAGDREAAMVDEDDAMLARLVKVRGHLWT